MGREARVPGRGGEEGILSLLLIMEGSEAHPQSRCQSGGPGLDSPCLLPTATAAAGFFTQLFGQPEGIPSATSGGMVARQLAALPSVEFCSRQSQSSRLHNGQVPVLRLKKGCQVGKSAPWYCGCEFLISRSFFEVFLWVVLGQKPSSG